MNAIVHFDEVFLKGKNQSFFVNTFIENIRQLFKKSAPRRIESGILIKNISNDDLYRLSLTPGVANFSEVNCVKSVAEEIKNTVLKIDAKNKKSFRITATRSDKKFALTSVEIEKQIGAAFQKFSGLKVDLENFDLNINIDVGSKESLVYSEQKNGIGGLPVGTTGKIMCLISGGIDSPVAAYKMMVRGAKIEAIHFQNRTSTSDESTQKIFDIVKSLSNFQNSVALHVVSFEEVQRRIVMKIPADYRMILTKKYMIKIAAEKALKRGCGAICTGDSLGQVASQTLENMRVIYEGSKLPIFSPLIGTNKSEIMQLSKRIKTLDISNRPYEDCCSLIVSKHPQTKAKKEYVDKLESMLDLRELDKIPIISYHISM
jgi:thiamine biosynthesis protein ThiI